MERLGAWKEIKKTPKAIVFFCVISVIYLQKNDEVVSCWEKRKRN